MNLLAEVVSCLEAAAIPFALIGAGALAAHRVARATGDVDLLSVDAEALAPATWRPLHGKGIEIEIRVGEPGDPLAGVVRISSGSAPPVDLVVGDRGWQRRAMHRPIGRPSSPKSRWSWRRSKNPRRRRGAAHSGESVPRPQRREARP